MPYCAVGRCRNGSRDYSKRSDENALSFHHFPKDPVVRKAWIESCGREDKMNMKTATICSDHFIPSDFSQYHQFLSDNFNASNYSLRRRLTEGAVPSLRLPRARINKKVNKSRAERQEKRDRKALVDQLLADYEKELEARSAAPQEVIELVQGRGGIRKLATRDDTTADDTAHLLEAPVRPEEIEADPGIRILKMSPLDNATPDHIDAAAAVRSNVTTEPKSVEAEPPEPPRIESVLNSDSVTAAAPPVALSEPEEEPNTVAASPVSPSEPGEEACTRVAPPREDITLCPGLSAVPPQPDRSRPAVGSVPSRDSTTIAAAPPEPDRGKRRVRSVRDNATVAAEAVASYADSVPMTADVAVLVTGGKVKFRSAAAAAETPKVSTPVDSPADDDDNDDRPLFEDDGVVPGGDSDEEGTTPTATDVSKGAPYESSKSVPRDAAKEVPPIAIAPKPAQSGEPKVAAAPDLSLNLPPDARAITLISTMPSGTIPERNQGDNTPSFCTRRSYRRSSLMVDRTKEILRLKMRVRKLEDKCRRVLSVPSSEPPTGETEEHCGGAEAAPAEAAPAAHAGETPLMVLRQERGPQKPPTILTKMQQYQLTESVAMFMPSDLQEAQEVNHQLKVQFLNLQATMLKWAIKNKRLRDSALREAEQKKDKSKKKTVSAARLRELLRLETAVKAMFTESQIRAISREHSRPAGSVLPAKRKGGPHWGEEDLRRVLELRAISSDRVVDHVREKMKIPLPSMAATKQRCKKSPELSEAYKAMVAKSEEHQKRCDVCDRQLTTIDEVIEAGADELPEEDVTFGRHFMQLAPPLRHLEQTAAAAVSRPRKRGRAPAAPAGGKKARAAPVPVTPSLDWPHTADSDAELSDPDVWDRIADSDDEWQAEDLVHSTPAPRKQARPGPMMQLKRAWR